MALNWNNATPLPPRSYVCSYCNHTVGPAQGFFTKEVRTPGPAKGNVPMGYVYVCSYCGKPTYFDDSLEKQHPGAPVGNSVNALPPDVEPLYEEARLCLTVNAFTSAVLTCRKLLMHLAVEKGALENKSFLTYVQYLADQGYVPPNGKGWVDYIRTKGNEANHEIKVMSEQDAKDLITFTEMLLKFVYEFPAKVQPVPVPASLTPPQP